MALWKARVEFLLSVIKLRFLSLTVEALQGKISQNSLPSGAGGSAWAMHRNEIPYLIWIKFGSMLAIPHIITYTNLGDDRLRDLGVVGWNYHSDRLSSSSLQHSRTTVRVCALKPGLKLAFLNRAQTRVLQQAAVNDWMMTNLCTRIAVSIISLIWKTRIY